MLENRYTKCIALEGMLKYVWFQNRRAKWRKQARLQLLQDAWRMRCLGLGSATPLLLGRSSTGGLERTSDASSTSPSSSALTGSPNTTDKLPEIGNPVSVCRDFRILSSLPPGQPPSDLDFDFDLQEGQGH
ncbi:PREDICTED: uncharacterized protein LOC105155036 [Acromyrmex echinatior]|uniref:uncharacterized protein LOC105155036 n=1 Tax=Acromyrmex echinatior TaxID=103372 RepID=UPI000580F6B2|nr:PREDICTED: uncharacterized protein LOC105155036 [Acromyrmex echinatior]